MSSPTFEEVDRHIEAADLTALQPATGERALSLPNVCLDVCTAYRVVRPMLQFGSTMPLPPKWRAALAAFVGVLDALCPPDPTE